MTQQVRCKAILFDMDGTLLDSTPAVEYTMTEWCKSQGIDPAYFFEHSHGVRTQDNIKRFQRSPPGSSLSEAELDEAVKTLEKAIADNGQRLHEESGQGIVALPGAQALVQALRDGGARWGICTSATILYADRALRTAGFAPPLPDVLVTAGDCVHGKPHPEPYLNGLKGLNERLAKEGAPNGSVANGDAPAKLQPSDIIVFEDALSGLTAGREAGCRTMAVTTGGASRPKIEALDGVTHKVLNLDRLKVISATKDEIVMEITPLESEPPAN